MKQIAIIGGLGYVGLHLIEYLRESGDHITVFGRKNLEVLIEKSDNISVRTLNSIINNEKFDVVINLAYPSSYSRKKNFKDNINIVNTIYRISRPGTIIIHTSTIAVFGTNLDYPIIRDKINFRRDSHYTEVKIHIENLLQKKFKGYSLHIIRLGNVWGPNSPGWVNQIADRVLFQEPIPESANSAPSNVSFVLNICDFIQYLINNPEQGPKTFFHHFAEFGEITWGTIINTLGKYLGEQPVFKPFQIFFPKSLGNELKQLINPITPRTVFYKMLGYRVLSSYAKSLVDLIPAKYRSDWKSNSSNKMVSKNVTDIVLSNQVLFKHSISAPWHPKYNFDEAFDLIKKSMIESGYIIKD